MQSIILKVFCSVLILSLCPCRKAVPAPNCAGSYPNKNGNMVEACNRDLNPFGSPQVPNIILQSCSLSHKPQNSKSNTKPYPSDWSSNCQDTGSENSNSSNTQISTCGPTNSVTKQQTTCTEQQTPLNQQQTPLNQQQTPLNQQQTTNCTRQPTASIPQSPVSSPQSPLYNPQSPVSSPQSPLYNAQPTAYNQQPGQIPMDDKTFTEAQKTFNFTSQPVDETKVLLLINGEKSSEITKDEFENLRKNFRYFKYLSDEKENKALFDPKNHIIYTKNGRENVTDDSYSLFYNGNEEKLLLYVPNLKESERMMFIVDATNEESYMANIQFAALQPKYKIKFGVKSGIKKENDKKLLLFISKSDQASRPVVSIMQQDDFEKKDEVKVPIKITDINIDDGKVKYETIANKPSEAQTPAAQNTEAQTPAAESPKYLYLDKISMKIFIMLQKLRIFE